MKILIIEDQPEKAHDINKYIFSMAPSGSLEIVIKESLRDGLMYVVTNNEINLIILDMSMPNFTTQPGASRGAEPVSFAGFELMKQMKIREIFIPTIVVTQYAIFEKDNVTLKDLDVKFKQMFEELYVGSVYYSSASDDWKEELNKLIVGILK